MARHAYSQHLFFLSRIFTVKTALSMICCRYSLSTLRKRKVTTGYCTSYHRHHTHTALHMTETYVHNTRYHPPPHPHTTSQHNTTQYTHTHTHHHHPRTRHATHVNDPRHAQYTQLIPALNTHNNTSQTQHRLHHYPAPTHMRTIHLTYRTGHAPTTQHT